MQTIRAKSCTFPLDLVVMGFSGEKQVAVLLSTDIERHTLPAMTQPNTKGEEESEPVFASRLRQASAGRNRDELCEQLGVHLRTFSGWVNGHNEPRARTIKALAEALDVSGDWLLGLVDDPRPAVEGPAMLVNEELEEAVLRAGTTSEKVERFIEWVPRLFMGLNHVPHRFRVVTSKRGGELRKQIDAAIKKDFPDLWQQWHELHKRALKHKPKE